MYTLDVFVREREEAEGFGCDEDGEFGRKGGKGDCVAEMHWTVGQRHPMPPFLPDPSHNRYTLPYSALAAAQAVAALAAGHAGNRAVLQVRVCMCMCLNES